MEGSRFFSREQEKEYNDQMKKEMILWQQMSKQCSPLGRNRGMV